LAYLWQGARGQQELLSRATPIEALIADEHTEPRLRDKLRLASELREFAVSDLALPDNGSYRRYADLKRPYVLWNVFATPAFSLKPVESCFPWVGCVAYRGYFAKADAEAAAAERRALGLDVHVGGVPAYSTLGWFDDPLPSTVIHYHEIDLARLIFHELAHQVVYVKDDTTFNESFAVAVEEAGLARWVVRRDSPALKEELRLAQGRRGDFRALIAKTRRKLEALYAGAAPADRLREDKARIFAELRADHAAQRDGAWGGYRGFDAWFEQEINNATLLSVALYADRVDDFARLLANCAGEWPRFYASVRALAPLAPAERRAGLAEGRCAASR
jgi:predicted aminopeptidase